MQMRKQEFIEVKWLVQGHTANYKFSFSILGLFACENKIQKVPFFRFFLPLAGGKDLMYSPNSWICSQLNDFSSKYVGCYKEESVVSYFNVHIAPCKNANSDSVGLHF